MQEILTRSSCWWKTLRVLGVLLDSCLRRNDGEGREGIRGARECDSCWPFAQPQGWIPAPYLRWDRLRGNDVLVPGRKKSSIDLLKWVFYRLNSKTKNIGNVMFIPITLKFL